jgi:hypothetical protein
VWEVIIALYTGLKIRQIAGEMGVCHLFHRLAGGHFHGCECDEGGEPSILCPCNESEGDDEQLSNIQLLQKLKLLDQTKELETERKKLKI